VTARPTAVVLRALYLGDAITGLPALRMLRAARPDHRIVLAAPESVGQLALTAGVVDAVTPALELAPLTNAPRGADVAVDLHGNGPASRELLAATGAHRVVSYAGGDAKWRADEHEVERWRRLVGEAFGIAPPWAALPGSLPIPQALDGLRGHALVHPGAKAAARRWPPDRFAEVVRTLRQAGCRVAVTGGPGEERLARAVAGGAGEPLTGLPLPDLLACVAHARIVVCGDTGVAHIASVYGTPSVLLFGPTSPARWGPPPSPAHRVLWHGTEPGGDPHARQPDPALLAITVGEVLDAIGPVMRAVLPSVQQPSDSPTPRGRSAADAPCVQW
jgi:ADP-heptose:LPS heptosyltransferase